MQENVIKIICILLLSSTAVCAQEIYTETSPWEEEDIVPIYSLHDTTENYIISPGVLVVSRLIRLYEQKISTQSISRCPFYISCSKYAHQAVRKYGVLIGICLFIDRHFYRENSMIYRHYKLRETDTGVLKLDDSFYLLGKDAF